MIEMSPSQALRGVRRMGASQTSGTQAIDDVLTACRAAGVRLVRFLYCDNAAIVRGKAVHIGHLAEALTSGIGITVGMQAMNALDQLQQVPNMGPVGEVRLVADTNTFRLLPYAPSAAAVLARHVRLDGRPYEGGAREFLERMSASLAERDMRLRCAVENEFSLARERDGAYVPLDQSLCFSTAGMASAAPAIDAIVAALESQGISVEQYYPELGHGQQELTVTHDEALRAADTQVVVRETIRAVPLQFGLVASVAPKPWPDQAGNGAHVHFSLWDGANERNLFFDPTRRFGLSRTAEQFTAGILHHLPALLALTAPSANSYQRLLPQHWSSAFSCWGPDNREAAVRVPSTFWGREQASTNLEYKPADASSNPYLAFGGLIAAGLDGIERDLEPPPPLEVDPATLSEHERDRLRVAPYPTTPDAALEHLEQDEVMARAMGEPLRRSYLAVRRSEWTAYRDADDATRCRGHFLIY